MSRRLAILTDEPGWHGQRLAEAFARRGWRSTFVNLSECRLDIGTHARGACLPGFAQAKPDAVFVRGIAGGTLEEVVLRLNLLHALKSDGVPVFNDGRAIERSVDKALTSFLLSREYIPTPPTWITADAGVAEAVLIDQIGKGHRLVCKPLFGSQGQGVVMLDKRSKLPDPESVRGVYYLQQFIGRRDRNAFDWRVFVIGGRAVAAMQRQADGWLCNRSQGAKCRPAVLTPIMRLIAEQAVGVLDMDYAGVDLIHDPEGRLWVLEVNSIPAWKGLQEATRRNIADLLADYVIDSVCTPGELEVRA